MNFVYFNMVTLRVLLQLKKGVTNYYTPPLRHTLGTILL